MGRECKPFSFDDDIDRRVVSALKTHPMVLSRCGQILFAAGVADRNRKKAEFPIQVRLCQFTVFLAMPAFRDIFAI